MSFVEILLIPVYLCIFYLLAKRKSSKLSEPYLKKYYLRGFWIKMLASILFMLYYTYLTGGDTRSLYYAEGKNLFHLLLKDGSDWKYVFGSGVDMNPNLMYRSGNFGYYQSEANFMVIRITALLSFITFGYYTLIGLFFALYAYSGLWRLFMFFYEMRPHLHKAFALSILFFPSVVFWSSGLMKDSLCIGAMGWLTYSVYKILKGERLIRNCIALLVSVYLLSVVKVYILLAYAPLLVLFLFLRKVRFVKVSIFKYLISLVVLFGIVAVFAQIYDGNEEELNAYALDNLTETVAQSNGIFASMEGRSDAESTFNLGAIYDGSLGGLFNIAPFAIAATFYRPFIWETSKISQLMAAAESLVLIYFTLLILFKLGPLKLMRDVASDQLIIFCLLFALTFGLFVGASTLNFGTLVRYKIPCMPFYAIALFLLYDKMKTDRMARKEKKIMHQLQLETVG